MMRVDPQDREDILFLMKQADFSPDKMQSVLMEAVVPSVVEIRDAFDTNLTWLLSHLANQISRPKDIPFKGTHWKL
jgi:hypothetical protein